MKVHYASGIGLDPVCGKKRLVWKFFLRRITVDPNPKYVDCKDCIEWLQRANQGG